VIVVFGSVNIDIEMRVQRLPRPGETLLTRDYLMTPGGKGANQALAAARGGAEVHLIGMVGNDNFGSFALDLLNEQGVDVANVGEAVDQHTGCATIWVDDSGENSIIVGAGANMATTASQVPDAVLNESTVLLMQMEVSPTENWALVKRAKAQGARILLNVAPAAMVPEEILKAVDYLVVNELEGQTVAKEVGLGVEQATRVPRALASRYGLTCILTLGGAGLLCFGADGGWSIPSLPVAAIDTTAAGDAFVGNLAVALDQGMDIEQALRWGSVGAGLSCTKEGAQSAMPHHDDVLANLDRLPASRRLS
jgi:ribokinase|tara:strand:+ start:58677 stop:59603 length:927 start_codon:yes stop_codon:yes gene_type:complete